MLGFEVEHGRFGCWRPPLADAAWLARSAWMDDAGTRLWPLLGAVYAVEAVKRVRGLRLVGLAPKRHAKPVAAPAVGTVAAPAAPAASRNLRREVDFSEFLVMRYLPRDRFICGRLLRRFS